MTGTTPTRRWPLLLAVTLLAIAVALWSTLRPAGPTALAQEPTAAPATPSDCYNEVLKTEYGHCRLLEEAENEGRIKIESIYLELSNALHIFISRTEPIDRELAKYFETKAHQHMDEAARKIRDFREGRVTGLELGGWYDYNETCRGLTGDEKRYCYNKIIGEGAVYGLWDSDSFDHLGADGFPDPHGYPNMFMHHGGTEARKNIAGWASWRQLWPNKEDEKPKGVPEFDVSGIDIENIPQLVCSDLNFGSDLYLDTSCQAWVHHSNVGVAGLHLRYEGDRDTMFFHMTSPIPTDEEELEALKKIVAPYAYTELGHKVEFVPVKYNFGQLWKWMTILERFALSDANTIGITFVQIDTNHELQHAVDWIVPPLWVGGIRPVDYGDTVFDTDWHALRNILAIATSDSYRTADALPHLLPLLGIPTDAVGLILWHERRPSRMFTLEEKLDIPKDSQSTINETNESPNGETKGTEHSNNTETSSPTPSVKEQPASAIQQLNRETDNQPVPLDNITETRPNKPAADQQKESPADVRSSSGVIKDSRPDVQEPSKTSDQQKESPADVGPPSRVTKEKRPDGQETRLC